MADGLYYNDIREPIMVVDPAAVTLTTTNKALVLAANLPPLGAYYFNRVGKSVRIRIHGRVTTSTTPGNFSFGLYWGTGADANGTLLGTSTAVAAVASQTNLSFMFEWDVVCRTTNGASNGSLMVTGWGLMNEAIAVAHYLFPASAPAATTVDLSANNVLSPQALISAGASVTMTVHNMSWIALN